MPTALKDEILGRTDTQCRAKDDHNKKIPRCGQAAGDFFVCRDTNQIPVQRLVLCSPQRISCWNFLKSGVSPLLNKRQKRIDNITKYTTAHSASNANISQQALPILVPKKSRPK